ncbi:sugar phosphate isomerase/epimerase [Saccharobesus litoralis]|uniref:Sugar phosphate isomerase/epimerase n=1 Tax=Saccharobesus litoralis TaxID=2172099 RepID=A0A2S0VMH0_9ALTE|nr:sugar phosphate isomerase/epimerase family protein [Saccharobesus litoralis]AWB65396.1 sugar phosphate isomerase/epimerase [Saccharobesus litoralis]
MYLTGFADEASQDLDLQIKATKALGWNAIESRNINGKNIHDLTEEDFEIAVGKLESAGVHINCFGSAIANWAKSVNDPFDITLAEVERAIPRMKRLGTKLIRIMSYQRCEGQEQFAQERFARLREIVSLFHAHDLTPVHENCMNYGGMSWQHSLELIDNVPGLKLIYDTGNSPFMKDYAKGGDVWQDGWEFYNQVKPHVAYIHIKDTLNPKPGEKETYTMPGEGQGYVKEILADLQASGYDGGISIEPHLAAIFHDPAALNTPNDKSYDLYVEYGQKLMKILADMGYQHSLYRR